MARSVPESLEPEEWYRSAKEDSTDNAPASVDGYDAEGDVTCSSHDYFDAKDSDVLEEDGSLGDGEGGLVHWDTEVEGLLRGSEV